MKQVTPDDIKTAARTLLATSPKTTTLDVKNAVRALGFRCVQDEVSAAMADMYASGELTRDFNGGFYEYALPATSTPAVSRESTLDRVRRVLVGVIGLDADEVTPAATFHDDLGLDSLDLVEATMKLEGEFGVSVSDDALAKVETVGDIVALLDTLSGPVAATALVQPAASAFPFPVTDPDPASWKNSVPVGSWVVREADGTGDHVNPFAFDGSLHRDQARSAYAKLQGVPRDNTRARRVRA